MNEDVQKYLHDIFASIQGIESYFKTGKTFRRFKNNRLIRRAVERELEIIGEAVNRILKLEPEITIKGARKIVDLRNLIIHAYDSVDYEYLWAIIVNHLPVLKTEVQQLLGTEKSE